MTMSTEDTSPIRCCYYQETTPFDELPGSPNWTIAGDGQWDFLQALSLLSVDDWRCCFQDKYGSWAISLEDDVQPRNIRAIRWMYEAGDISLFADGEMLFTYDYIAKVDEFLDQEWEVD
jgi:hypothetical protein